MNKIWTPKILLPDLLRADPRLAAAQAALEHQLRLLSEAARECIFLPRLDELPESVLDLLAEQYHVDFYEPTGMSIEIKRSFIRDALLWHRLKGTPAAVETVLRRIFRHSDVKEWFEYGGEPFFFRVDIDLDSDDEPADHDTLERMRKAVKESKNARSWLETYNLSIRPQDAVKTNDTRSETVFIDRVDAYDYRRALVDFSGAYSFDGSHEFVSFQAPDFETMTIDLDVDWHQTVELRAENFSDVELTLTDETVPPTRDQMTAAVELDADQSVDAADRLGHFDLDVDEHHTIASSDNDFLIGAFQSVSFDGLFAFDGRVSADGIASAYFSFDQDALDRWEALRAELANEFDEACPNCGGRNYQWHRSSVRAGEEKFLVTDPQFLTVQIRCRRCKSIIAEYLLDDPRLEIRS